MINENFSSLNTLYKTNPLENYVSPPHIIKIKISLSMTFPSTLLQSKYIKLYKNKPWYVQELCLASIHFFSFLLT